MYMGFCVCYVSYMCLSHFEILRCSSGQLVFQLGTHNGISDTYLVLTDKNSCDWCTSSNSHDVDVLALITNNKWLYLHQLTKNGVVRPAEFIHVNKHVMHIVY